MNVGTALTALIAAGKGFQYVERLLKSGKVSQAKQMQKKLKGEDASKADVLIKAEERRIKEPGTSTIKGELHVKNPQVTSDKATSGMVEEAAKKAKRKELIQKKLYEAQPKAIKTTDLVSIGNRPEAMKKLLEERKKTAPIVGGRRIIPAAPKASAIYSPSRIKKIRQESGYVKKEAKKGFKKKENKEQGE